ncbi:MAG: GNAT family N-acetyltransferase [Porcipelethomonas sp.]
MVNIRKIERRDYDNVLEMMRVFYASPAVLSDPSEDILRRDIDDCLGDTPFIEGYVFEEEGTLAGYAMAAKSYSTEFGGMCIWIEDIYIVPQYRHKGIGSQFLHFIRTEYKGKAVLCRLEVEHENENAVAAYKKSGFTELPYVQMISGI